MPIETKNRTIEKVDPEPLPVPTESSPVQDPRQATLAAAKHKGVERLAIALALIFVLVVGASWIQELLSTTSTDDAYVNGHVTLLVPRVGETPANGPRVC